ncbi:hypothetical protein M422DRAFT_777751 [Sphaerobolus stellatus SS14]|nr:hypothetical protein M422DRAFT_777751 [Sphaerobolus stellatus SS14]
MESSPRTPPSLAKPTTNANFTTTTYSTGNGWSAMGMLRVLSTMKNSEFSGDFMNEQKDLTNWVGEILDGMYKHLDNSAILKNYADDSWSFQDPSSTALIAAATYRLATVTGTFKHLSLAEKIGLYLLHRHKVERY